MDEHSLKYVNLCEDESDESDDETDFTVPPNCELPHFLNNDYKWNECVKRTKTLQEYCSLIGQIMNQNIMKDDEIRIMFIITSDIVIRHRYLSPHWRLLQQHAYFCNHDIM